MHCAASPNYPSLPLSRDIDSHPLLCLVQRKSLYSTIFKEVSKHKNWIGFERGVDGYVMKQKFISSYRICCVVVTRSHRHWSSITLKEEEYVAKHWSFTCALSWAGSLNFLSNLMLRLQLSSSGLRWWGQIGTSSKYNKKKMKPERERESERVGLPFHLARRSACREVPRVSMWCWSCAVWTGGQEASANGKGARG